MDDEIRSINELMDDRKNLSEIYSASVAIAQESIKRYESSSSDSEKEANLSTAKKYFSLASSIKNLVFEEFSQWRGMMGAGGYDEEHFEKTAQNNYQKLALKFNQPLQGLAHKVQSHLSNEEKQIIPRGMGGWERIQEFYQKNI